MNRARIAILPMLILAACQSSAPAPTGTTSAEPSSLEGHILLTEGGMYNANADGGDRQLVYEEGEYCCVNRLSPDGTHILVMPGDDFTGAVTGGTLTIDGSVFALLPQAARRLSDEALNLVPSAWSPDGTRIAFEGWDDTDPERNGIYTALADMGDLVRVTTHPGLPHDSPLDYSPDGTQILFYRAVRAEPDFPIDIGGSLWIVNVDGTDEHQLDTGDVRHGGRRAGRRTGRRSSSPRSACSRPVRSGPSARMGPTSRRSSRIPRAGSLGPRSGLPTGARSCSTSTPSATILSTPQMRSRSSTPTAPNRPSSSAGRRSRP